MPIHHDKSVYGKLAATKEAISEEDLIAMAQELSLEEDSDEQTKKDAKYEKQSV